MIRTLALRVFPNDDYANPLINQASDNAVRLLYAILAGGNFVEGGVVPGGEFEHVGSGVWEREVDTSMMDDARSDYYYVQYRVKDGTWGQWTNITGFDPFFFNTKVLSGYVPSSPTISALIPSQMVISENAMSIVFRAPGTYTNSGIVVSGSNIYEIDVALPGVIDGWEIFAYYENPETLPWTSIRSSDLRTVLHRIGDNLSKGCQVFYRYRVYNPITMEYSAYSRLISGISDFELLTNSAQEIIDAEAVDPMANMAEGDVDEVDTYGKLDSVSVKTPQLGIGTHVGVAVQFGGVKPTIVGGALTGFTGRIYRSGEDVAIIPKPLSLTGPITVYIARRRVGLTTASDWVGVSDVAVLEKTITEPGKLSLVSSDMLDAITSYVASKLETADGTSVVKKA